MNKNITLFLDTNIFLHYQLFDQINWSSLFGVSDIEIIIPPVTIHELNKHKDAHTKPRVRSRASDIIKKLFGLFEDSTETRIGTGLIVHLEDREPQIDFIQHQLSREVKDDELIASILYLKAKVPEKKVILVTSDFGLILLGKAKRQGIEVYRLPDTYKLLEEPDPSEKKILELQTELRKIKNTMPEVLLVFENEKDHIRYSIKSPKPHLTSVEIENLLEKVKSEHPPMQNIQRDLKSKGLDSASLALAMANSITSADIDAYNQELEKYYADCEDSFQKQLDYENLLARTLKLDIWVSNTGTAPAEDLDIYMHFPDGFALFSEDEFPEAPQFPEQPSEPTSSLGKALDMSRLNEAIFSISNNIMDFNSPHLSSNVSGLDIRRTNSYDVEFHIERLKHKIHEAADTIYITFTNYDDVKSFEIYYRILVANLAEPTEGKLHVIIEKS